MVSWLDYGGGDGDDGDDDGDGGVDESVEGDVSMGGDGDGDDRERAVDRSGRGEDGMDMDTEAEAESEGEEDVDDADTLSAGLDGDAAPDAAEVERLRQRRREETDEVLYPDEVETPLNVPARVRFGRYRGMKSFRTSPWDPKENLPPSYSRIFQLANFRVARRRTQRYYDDLERKAAADELVAAAYPGQFVCLFIHGVPHGALAARGGHSPLVVGGLLRHENRTSVLNVRLARRVVYDAPIKSKEAVEVHVGWRRSTDDLNSDRHKYERFFRPGAHCVASMYAPITFTPAPVLMFSRDAGGQRVLVATGTVQDANPDRIVLKKIVLSGYPLKLRKRVSTIRFMFFSPDDVRFFKPVELWTKHGAAGHIREPVGTHGLMKCVFNKQIKSHDTVCMSLYKRVFPKDSGFA